MEWSKLTYDDILDHPEIWGDGSQVLPMWADDVAYYGGIPCSTVDMYDDIWQGGLEPHRAPGEYVQGEYGGIAIVKNMATGRVRRYTLTEDGELYDLVDNSGRDDFILTSPITYAGKARSAENARYLYALTIEIDNIAQKGGIQELFYSWERKTAPNPRPTYVVCSGSGLHLYLVFDRPIPLYKANRDRLAAIKTNLTPRYWTRYAARLDDQHPIQYEPLSQGFRVPGSRTKNGHIALAFRVGPKLSCDDLNHCMGQHNELMLDPAVVYGHQRGGTPLSVAREKWPAWYQRRIVEHQSAGHYNRHPALYEWWLQKVLDPGTGVSVGHRYYCLENLCALGVQCQIPKGRMETDAQRVANYLETLTASDDNHFTKSDLRDALQTYYVAADSAYRRRVEYISRKTGITLTRAKRNGRSQANHLIIARGMKAMRAALGEDVKGGGRRSAQKTVQAWRREHPDGRKVDCIRDTGLSKPTVYKWWDDII